MYSVAQLFGPWVVTALALPILFVLLRRVPFERPPVVVLTMVLVIALLQLDSVVMGPLARNEIGDGQTLFFGYFPYLANHLDSLFLTALGGGSDRFALGRIGGELVSLQIELCRVLPLWAVLVVLRVFVPAIACSGMWLFATRILKAPRHIAVAAACLYAVFDFSAALTFLYGLSVAGLPLLFYALFGCALSVWGLLAVAIVILVYVSAADIFYGLPVFLTLLAALLLWVRPRSWKILIGGSCVFVALWFLNYAEAIYAYLQFLPYSGRVTAYSPVHETLAQRAVMLLKSVPTSLAWIVHYTIYFASPIGIAVNAAVVTAAFLTMRARRYDLLAVVALPILILIAADIMSVLPWGSIGLGFLSTFRWDHFYYTAPMLAFLVLCYAAATTPDLSQATNKVSRAVAALLMAITLGQIVNTRLFEIGWVPHHRNLAGLGASANIKPKEVGMEPDFRVVSIPTGVDCNFAVDAGLDSYDVAATLVNGRLITYWQKGIQKFSGGTYDTAGFASNPDFDSCCDSLPFANYADIDLLRVANVRYVLSYRRLSDPRLRQLAGPQIQQRRKWWQDAFEAPPPLLIYEIANPLPLAFAARRVDIVVNDIGDDELLAEIRQKSLDRVAVMSASSAAHLKAAPGIVADTEVAVGIEPIKDGYAIEMPPHHPAMPVVVNVPYYPWWKARDASGQELPVAAANMIHTVVIVPPDGTAFHLTYERPTLFKW